MKIYTEKDIQNIVAGVFSKAYIPFTRTLTKELGYEEEAVDTLIRKINETYNLHINRFENKDITLNKIIELMNREIGLDDVIIREFIKEICEANPDKDAIIFDGKHYTYRQIMVAVNNLSAGLIKLGITK